MDSLDTESISQILSFGPALIEESEIVVDADSEVDKAVTSNPRTAIGQIDEGHYIIVVSDGRTDESAGLTLLQLATVMQDQGCTVAYNLDGGGSSTMVFNGQVINQPTSGKTIEEREVSDIVYIGY
jgi:exopolysaccharide biosynthesis protein